MVSTREDNRTNPYVLADMFGEWAERSLRDRESAGLAGQLTGAVRRAVAGHSWEATDARLAIVLYDLKRWLETPGALSPEKSAARMKVVEGIGRNVSPGAATALFAALTEGEARPPVTADQVLRQVARSLRTYADQDPRLLVGYVRYLRQGCVDARVKYENLVTGMATLRQQPAVAASIDQVLMDAAAADGARVRKELVESLEPGASLWFQVRTLVRATLVEANPANADPLVADGLTRLTSQLRKVFPRVPPVPTSEYGARAVRTPASLTTFARDLTAAVSKPGATTASPVRRAGSGQRRGAAARAR